jgi:hypothetical protein
MGRLGVDRGEQPRGSRSGPPRLSPPYRHARFDVRDDSFGVTAERGAARFAARYAGEGRAAPADAGTLEHFLVERYCLYSGGGTLRAEIHHKPWLLRHAAADVRQEGVAPVTLDGEPLCHFAARQDVVVWRPEATPHARAVHA